jgi:voltage-gated potassium channel Kch
LVFTGLAVTFLKQFALGIGLTFPLLFSLGTIIALIGQLVGLSEGWSRLDSLYWSFITATTVGYGDLRPITHRSRLLAVLIAFLGLILSGIVIAVAVEATTLALNAVRH